MQEEEPYELEHVFSSSYFHKDFKSLYEQVPNLLRKRLVNLMSKAGL